jgi:DNA topoisomerase III
LANVLALIVIFNPYMQDNAPIAMNIQQQARYARALFIWTDCDREGEYIGNEVRDAAFKGNSRLEVKRAKFSNIERA